MGLGVCDNCKKTLDRINRTFDEFNEEVRRGKRRIGASEMLLKSRVENGQVKMYFDDDEDTFQIIPGANMDDYTIKDLTSDIRTTEYVAAINHHLRTLEMETNLSSGTFSFDSSESYPQKQLQKWSARTLKLIRHVQCKSPISKNLLRNWLSLFASWVNH